jgi:hypothetical protein
VDSGLLAGVVVPVHDDEPPAVAERGVGALDEPGRVVDAVECVRVQDDVDGIRERGPEQTGGPVNGLEVLDPVERRDVVEFREQVVVDVHRVHGTGVDEPRRGQWSGTVPRSALARRRTANARAT